MQKRDGGCQKHSEGVEGLHMDGYSAAVGLGAFRGSTVGDRAKERDGRTRVLRNLKIQHRQTSTISESSKHSRNVSGDIATGE